MRKYLFLFVGILSILYFRSCSTNGSGSFAWYADIMNIRNSKYVPAPRNLKSTQWNYFYSFASLTQRDEIASKLCDYLLNACESNNIDPYIVARKVWRETHFQVVQHSYLPEKKQTWVITDGSSNVITTIETNRCAYGITQVNLKMWKKKLWDYKGGMLRPKLNNFEDYEREIIMPEVNIDIGVSILRDYLDMFDERYDYALCAFWSGENSSYIVQLKNGIGNEYVTWIKDEEKALEEMTMYSFRNPDTGVTRTWRYIQRRDEGSFKK